MAIVTFIYFILLFVYCFNKADKKIDLACFVVLLYGVSAFFAILIDYFGLRSWATENYQISFGATFIYCFLLTVCILPFSRNSTSKIKFIRPIQNDKILRIIAWVAFVYCVFDFIMSFSQIRLILSGDLGESRRLHYLGLDELGWLARLSSIQRIPFIILNIVLGGFWILQFLGFYCFYIQKMPKLYFALFLIGSLRGLISNTLASGRSAAAYWMIGVVACAVFFKSFITKKNMRNLFLVSAPVFAALMLYISMVTDARFGERYMGNNISGSQGGIISYMGQSYINFCYFWDTFKTPQIYWQNLFPLSNYIIGNPIRGGVPVQTILSLRTGQELGVFYTFIGQLQTSMGHLVAIIYCVILSIVSSFVVGRIKINKFTLIDGYIIMILASVLFLGLFGHYYVTAYSVGSLLFFLIVFYNAEKH